MEKQTMVRDMKAFVGGSSFITATKLAKFLGKEKEYAYRLVKGLDYIPAKIKGRKYFIPDVVQKIMEAKRT